MKRLAMMTAWKIQENPSIAAGICIFALAFTFVAANALVGQNGGHPTPVWASRDLVTTRSVPASGQPTRRPAVAAIETLSPDKIPVPVMRPDLGSETPANVLVRDAQAGLARLGIYNGIVDGIYGPRTQEAVVSFQRQHGMTQDGQVSTALTMAIDTATALSIDRDSRANGAAAAKLNVPVLEARPDPAAGSSTDVERTAMVARIQIGLNNFGETGITVNGTVDPRTAAAIRNFQSRYDLPVSGEPDQQLMEKLEEIGALRQR
jgi:peptidoglycan hydrolase-like protein with peptidoglycan-binding domain